MDSLLFTLNALTPLLLLALLGYYLRRKGIFDEIFVARLHWYVFYVALPVLIFITLSSMEDLRNVNWYLVLFAVGMMMFILLVGWVVVYTLKLNKQQKPVLLQSFFRGNFMLIGIPLAIRIGGVEALGIMALLNAFLVPLSNFFSIVVFTIASNGNKFSAKIFTAIYKDTLHNPLMIAIFLGIGAYFLGYKYWFETVTIVPDAFTLIAATATPMALVAIGAQFQITRAKNYSATLIISVIGRLIIVPIIVFILASYLGRWIDFSQSWAALIALFASPVAVSSVAVTKGLNGDDDLAAQIVIWSTVAATLTLFVIVLLSRMYGLI